MIQNPNIPVKNIYHMLCYAFQSLRPDELVRVETEDFEHIHDLFAAILSTAIGRQLKQGLHREYVEHTERLTTLRGGIDLADTVRVRLVRRCQIACKFDELSENNLLNQILKTTALLLLRHGEVSAPHRDALRNRLLFLGGVDQLHPANIRWADVRFGRNCQGYRLPIGLCQLVLTGMLLGDRPGECQLSSFIDDQAMHRLYEKFILHYYMRHCRLAKASSPQIRWALDQGQPDMLPAMQSDIVLSNRAATLIIDAKYYSNTTQHHYERHKVHSNNLYQIFTYVKNKEAEVSGSGHQVAGLLLYAKTSADVQPDNTYFMSGNRIGVRTLDLNVEFSSIARQLDQIAEEHFICDQPLFAPHGAASK